MKRILAGWLLVGWLLSAPGPLTAQRSRGDAGLGVYVGVPFGVTGKYFLDRDLAAAAALGVQGDGFDAHVDLLTHLRDLFPSPRKGGLPAHLGLGLKIKDDRETLFGLRFVGGFAYLPTGHPLEFFAEIAPVLRLAPSTGSNFDGGVGLRYYFSRPGN